MSMAIRNSFDATSHACSAEHSRTWVGPRHGDPTGIRQLLRRRLHEIEAGGAPSAAQKQMQLIERMRAAPVALMPDAANAQHYEIPVEFFEHVLGPHLKYSSTPTGPIRILTHLRYFGYVQPGEFLFLLRRGGWSC